MCDWGPANGCLIKFGSCWNDLERRDRSLHVAWGLVSPALKDNNTLFDSEPHTCLVCKRTNCSFAHCANGPIAQLQFAAKLHIQKIDLLPNKQNYENKSNYKLLRIKYDKRPAFGARPVKNHSFWPLKHQNKWQIKAFVLGT